MATFKTLDALLEAVAALPSTIKYLKVQRNLNSFQAPSDYLDMKEMLVKLDSNSVQVQGALDILDSYFENKAINQFELESKTLKHWLLVEFGDYFGGEKLRLLQISKQDKDILKALEILNDPISYNKVFNLQ